jgi:hypothetical protein
MKTMQKTKTLTRDELAGRHGEGSSTTPGDGYTDSMPRGAEKIEDFFSLRYVSLSKWCHSRYNGSGGDVLNSVVVIATERGYTYMTMALFRMLAREAARDLQLARWVQSADGTIILPPTPKAAERLGAHLAVAPANDNKPEFPADCIRAARKMIRLEKKGQPCLWSAGGAA